MHHTINAIYNKILHSIPKQLRCKFALYDAVTCPMRDYAHLYKKLQEFHFNGFVNDKEAAMISAALDNDDCTVSFDSTPLFKGDEPDGVRGG